jgi:hypothetical protein
MLTAGPDRRWRERSYGDSRNRSRVPFPRRQSALPLVPLGLWRHVVPRPLTGKRVTVLGLGYFYVEATTTSGGHNKVLPALPHTGGVSSAGGGSVQLCVPHITWDLVGFCVCFGVISGLSLPIYGTHLGRWLVLW